MSDTRPPKKSETLEVRMPPATKQAFIEACRTNGETASEAVRAFVDGYLEPGVQPDQARAENRCVWARRPLGWAALAVGAVRARLPESAMRGGALAFTATSALLVLGVISIAANGDRAIFTAGAPDANNPTAEAVSWSDPGADRVARDFLSFDADGDGRVDFDEFEAQRRCLLHSTFRSLDVDRDGPLSREEFTGWPGLGDGDCLRVASGRDAARPPGVAAAP